VLGVMNSFAAGYWLGIDACTELLARAATAAVAVWAQNWHSWRWNQGSFLFLGVGMLRGSPPATGLGDTPQLS
jgi:hypothetical protein